MVALQVASLPTDLFTFLSLHFLPHQKKMAGILGVLVLALYGDRSLYYQDPYNYQGGYTKLTPLGEVGKDQV